MLWTLLYQLDICWCGNYTTLLYDLYSRALCKQSLKPTAGLFTQEYIFSVEIIEQCSNTGPAGVLRHWKPPSKKPFAFMNKQCKLWCLMWDYSAPGNIVVITAPYNQWALCCKWNDNHKEVERGAEVSELVSFAVSNHKAMQCMLKATEELQMEIETPLHYTPCCITDE